MRVDLEDDVRSHGRETRELPGGCCCIALTTGLGRVDLEQADTITAPDDERVAVDDPRDALRALGRLDRRVATGDCGRDDERGKRDET